MANVKQQLTQQNNQPQVMPPFVVDYTVDGQRIQINDADVMNMILDAKTAGLVQPYEVIYFLQQCKAQRLNPFVRDAYLIKYDADSPAQIVTSVASLEKRAEDYPEFEGIRSGVIIYNPASGEIEEREGTLVIKSAGEELVGGWAEVYRSDRKNPIKATVNFDEYNTGKSTWKQKPGVMIRKCAKAMALREAFPKSFTGLYDADEISGGTEYDTTFIQPEHPKQLHQPHPQQQYQSTPAPAPMTMDPQTGEIYQENPF